MSELKIIDRPGVIPVEKMRGFFEASINGTSSFKKNTPLGIMEINGKFSHYMDADTDTMWLGFALGLRFAERAAKARVALCASTLLTRNAAESRRAKRNEKTRVNTD